LFPDSFSTARLRAERLQARHWGDIRAMDSDAAYMALLGGKRDQATTWAYLERNLQHWDDYNYGLWMLRDASDNRVAGRCVIRHLLIDNVDEVELGYGFHVPYWGKGLATETAKELLRLGREKLRLPSLVAITRPENIGSRRVLEKAGLVYERDVDHDHVPHVLNRST
jgi:ribosomal-protein-alanine N-acetyltransferase